MPTLMPILMAICIMPTHIFMTVLSSQEPDMSSSTYTTLGNKQYCLTLATTKAIHQAPFLHEASLNDYASFLMGW